MLIITLFVALILSLFSTSIMSYISMATPIGPWIETTLVLIGMLIFTALRRWFTEESRTKALVLTTAAGGIGGILATGLGFSFPTLYFVDPVLFNSLMKNPIAFAMAVSALGLAAGSLGLLSAHLFEQSLIVKQALPFPIGELIYKTISAVDSMKKAIQLAIGFIGTQLALIFHFFTGLAKSFQLLPHATLGLITIPRTTIQMDTLPMFWAIGFVTGELIAIPLLAGIIARLVVIEPLYKLYPATISFFNSHGMTLLTTFSQTAASSYTDYNLAFCSGMVLYGAVFSFFGLPSLLMNGIKKILHLSKSGISRENSALQNIPWFLISITLIFNAIALTYFGFSPLYQIYLLFFAFICAYQMGIIAGKIGLAPLGRFATFVMVPGMVLFGYDPLQTTVVAAYVEIAGGVACDALFGRKMAQLARVDKRVLHWYQWLGLLISVASVGFIFWAFINHFGLGDQPGAFAAAKAASRALLIDVKTFDPLVLCFGFLFGYLLKFIRINPVFMLGGILMPINYSILLIFGGLSTYLVRDKESYYPFWSGVYAANSLWMLLQAFL